MQAHMLDADSKRGAALAALYEAAKNTMLMRVAYRQSIAAPMTKHPMEWGVIDDGRVHI
jgi:hypothetical protein